MMKKEMERRISGDLEIRQSDTGKRQIVGYPAVFDALSNDLGGWFERIEPGAFTKSLGGDVRALKNHDTGYILGRTTAGTLALEEDARGLHMVVDPPDAQWSHDLMVSIDRGDIDQMSFGFNVPPGGEIWDGNIRTLTEIDLWEVSVVVFPAYPQTSVSVRDKLAELRAQQTADQHKADEDATGVDHSLRHKAIDILTLEG